MHLRELDTNLIVILDALLLEASVTKAAERLGRSPSAISHALARLRDVFDDPLFVRAGQRLVPTSRAMQLAPTVHIIVAGLEGLLQREGGFDPRDQQGRYALACRDYMELTLLPALRARLADAAPGIIIARHDETGVIDALRLGRVDLAIVEGSEDTGAPDISAKAIFVDPFAALLPAEDVDFGPQPEGPGTKTIFADRRHVPLSFDTTDPQHTAQLEMVASPLVGLHAACARRGIALVPESMAALGTGQMRMRRVDLNIPLPPLSYHLIWHRSREHDPCHAWLREHCLRWAKAQHDAAPAPAPTPGTPVAGD